MFPLRLAVAARTGCNTITIQSSTGAASRWIDLCHFINCISKRKGGIKMSDYKILDQYEKHAEKEFAHADKTFDHPLDNDPLHHVEQHIESPHMFRPQDPVIAPPDDYYKVPKSGPIPPPRQDFRPGGFTGADAPRPDVLEGEHHAWWREPRIPPLRGTPGKSTKPVPRVSVPTRRGYTSKKKDDGKTDMVRCPMRDDSLVPKKICKTCRHYRWKTPYHGFCKLKEKDSKED
jgi:hypothetical protein